MGVVLVVDDNRSILDAISEALTDEGWDVVPATSGEEATEAARSHKLDVVLCDVLLNDGADGLALRDGFANQGFGHLPFVFTTASLREAARLEREFVLRKPFSVSELIEFLNAALTRQESGGTMPAIDGTSSGRSSLR